MATWKKIVVSGSGVSQLSNDANYLTTSGNGSNLTNLTWGNITNAQEEVEDIVGGLIVGGTNITATYDDANGTLTIDADLAGDITSIVAGNGLTTPDGSTGDVTINVVGGDGITANADEIEVTVDGSTIELSASDGTGAVRVKDGGISTAKLANNSVTADKLDDVFSNTPGAFGSQTAVPVLTIDGQGRIVSASTAAIATSFDIAADSGTTDTVAGGETLTFAGGNGVSTTVSDNNIQIDIAGGIVSASNFSSPSQGTVRATINGVNADVDTGLQTGDSPTFAGLTISNNATIQGDLIVNGTTTTIATTNTTLKDKFILLNSGSANPDEGGLVIDGGDGSGNAFIFDAGDARWGFNSSVSATDTTANSEAYVAAVLDEDNVAHDVTAAAYQKRGNIKVDSNDDIFIYV